MKKTVLTLNLLLISILGYSQDLEVLTYEQANNYDDFVKIKKGKLKSYIAKDGTILKVGDTILLGQPSNDAKYYSSIELGDSMSKSTGGLGGFINDNSDDNSAYLPEKYQGQKATIVKMKHQHDGSKKKPIIVRIAIDPIHGAFGMNSKATIHNVDKTLERREIIHRSTPISRDYAIELLKSFKEEMDLGILSTDEFEHRKTKLLKIINP